MTEYEKLVKNGKMVPMNGMDVLLMEVVVEDILNGDINETNLEVIEDVMIEVEHLYKNDTDKLIRLKTIINEYKKNTYL